MEVVTLTRSGQTVKLYGVTHIAKPGTYEVLNSEIKSDYDSGHTIFSEGVGGAPNLNLRYGELAGIMGLDVQKRLETPHINNDLCWCQLRLTTRVVVRLGAGLMKVLCFALRNMTPEKAVEMGTKFIDTPPVEDAPGSRLLCHDRDHHAVNVMLNHDPSNGNQSSVWGRAHLKGQIKILESNGYTVTDRRDLLKGDD